MGYATRIFKKRQAALCGPKISAKAADMMRQNDLGLEDFPATLTYITVKEVRQAIIFKQQKSVQNGNQEKIDSEEE